MRRLALAFALALGVLAGSPAAAQKPAPAPAAEAAARPHSKLLMVGSGDLLGLYHPVAGAICRLLNRDRAKHGLRCSADITGGAVPNLDGLREGEYELALVQSDLLWAASRGEGPYADRGRFDELRSVFALYPEAVSVLARKEINARLFSELAGKRLWVGEPGTSLRRTAEDAIRLLGLPPTAISVVELPESESGIALCDGRIDAMVRVGGHPAPAFRMPTSVCGARFVNASAEAIAQVTAARPYFMRVEIPGNLYASNPVDINTFGVRAMLATTSRLPADDVYAIAKAVFDNFQELRKLHPALDHLSHADMVEVGAIAPLHVGATRLYREKGWLKP